MMNYIVFIKTRSGVSYLNPGKGFVEEAWQLLFRPVADGVLLT